MVRKQKKYKWRNRKERFVTRQLIENMQRQLSKALCFSYILKEYKAGGIQEFIVKNKHKTLEIAPMGLANERALDR